MEIAAPSRRMQDPMLKVTDDENSVKQQLTEMELATLNNELRSWYYSEGEGGYGIFLSNDTAALYRQAVKSVLSAVPNDAQATRNVVDKLSTLRSWTKNEIAVFGRWEY